MAILLFVMEDQAEKEVHALDEASKEFRKIKDLVGRYDTAKGDHMKAMLLSALEKSGIPIGDADKLSGEYEAFEMQHQLDVNLDNKDAKDHEETTPTFNSLVSKIAEKYEVKPQDLIENAGRQEFFEAAMAFSGENSASKVTVVANPEKLPHNVS